MSRYLTFYYPNTLPDTIGVAVSGGVDSMACMDFLIQGGRKVIAVHFNHGTKNSRAAEEFVTEYCKDNDIELRKGKIDRAKNEGESLEEYWRNCRYKFLDSVSEEFPIITCHHLNDCVETWLMSTLQGVPKLIPLERNNIIRPFLRTPKQNLISWAKEHDVPWIEDDSNNDDKFLRNKIRHKLMPIVYDINPGIEKVVLKKLKRKQNA